MSHSIKAAGLFLLITTLVVPMSAQVAQRKDPPGKKPPEASAESLSDDELLTREQRRALWLLGQLFEEAKSLADESLKLRLQAQIADLLWKYDEPRARLQFEETFRAAAAIQLAEPDAPSAPPLPPEFSPQFLLRGEVLELISQHDPQWASRLAESVGMPLKEAPESLDPDRKEGRQEALTSPKTMSHAQTGAPGAPQAAPGSAKTFSKSMLISKSIRPASVQDLLRQAEAARHPIEKNDLYTRAVLQALSESDLEQALSITEKISHGQTRAKFDSMVRYRAAMAALAREDFDAADRYGRGLANLLQRAALCSEMARALQRKKDFGRAAGIIDDAGQSIGKAKDGPEKARAWLMIAGAAAQLDPLRGFEVMQSAVEAINHAEIGGTSTRPAMESVFELSKFNFDQSFTLLARADFDRAVQLAQAIAKKEVSVQAQLALCRAVLTGPGRVRSEK